MKRMLDRIGFETALLGCGLPPPGSNRGDRPEQLLIQFMLSVGCGANRFEHQEVTRFDPVLQRLFGFKRMANFKAVMRLFRKFSRAVNEAVLGSLYRWWFTQLSLDPFTLDLDSTVMTCYGPQEGSACGYNPAKRGRASHHPLMAFIADGRRVANCWLRPGNAHTANHGYSSLLLGWLKACAKEQVHIPAKPDTRSDDAGHPRSIATQAGRLFIRLSAMGQGGGRFSHRLACTELDAMRVVDQPIQ